MPKSNGSNEKRVANRLTQVERDQLQTLLFDPLYADLSVFQLYWHAFNQGQFMASLSTFYRIAKSIQASGDRRPLATHPKRTPPILLATGVNQVWCWDIIRLPGHVCGHHYFLFALIDLFSRFVIGWMLATKENAELACHFLRENIRHAQRDFPIQHLVTHSDRGAPMIASSTLDFLQATGIKVSFSRPRVSDDNPFIESLFKTLKYTPSYPGFFLNQAEADTWLHQFTHRYHHLPHKGLNGYTPYQAYTSQWVPIFHDRQAALDLQYKKYPARFSKPPKAKPLPNMVSINVHTVKTHMDWPQHELNHFPPQVHSPDQADSGIATLISNTTVSNFP